MFEGCRQTEWCVGRTLILLSKVLSEEFMKGRNLDSEGLIHIESIQFSIIMSNSCQLFTSEGDHKNRFKSPLQNEYKEYLFPSYTFW